MDKHIIQVIMERQAEDDMVSELRSYSGRGMFGKECLGIDTDGLCYTMARIIRTACQMTLSGPLLDDLCQAVESARTDSMGKGTIVYFPGVQYVGPDRDEDPDEG